MMRALIVASLVGVVAACMTPEKQAGEASACGAEKYQNLIGVAEADLDRSKLPEKLRIICAACMVTQDYVEDRLNIHLSADGKVGSLRCG